MLLRREHSVVVGKYYRAEIYAYSGAKKTVVTFQAINSKKKAPVFALKPLLDLPVNIIGVNCGANTYYQGISPVQLMHLVSPFLSTEIITYGSSLGGWAALYFGSFLGAKVIAAAPKQPADPRFLESGYPEPVLNFIAGENYAFLPLSRQSINIIYDPYVHQDRHIVRELIRPLCGNLQEFLVPHGSHSVLAYLKEVGVLKAFLLNLLFGDSCDLNLPLHSPIPRYFLSKSRWYATKHDAVLSAKHFNLAINSMNSCDKSSSSSLSKLIRKARRDLSKISPSLMAV